MAVSPENIKRRSEQISRMASRYGIEGSVAERLSDEEAIRFSRAFERQFIIELADRPALRDMYIRHLDEIILGALIAKDQMDADIGGEFPNSGQIGGPIQPRAIYFGIGDDWADIGDITTGSPQNWIHSGTTVMGGTSGNPIRVGRNAVHVIFGIGDEAPSPKLENVKFEVDGKEKPIIMLGEMLRLHNALRIKEFEKSMFFRRNTTVKATVFASAQYGSTVTSIPYLVGVSYVAESVLRVQDAANVPGTTYDVVLTA